MTMESPFTLVDNSIDIVGALFFLSAIYWASRYILENHLSVPARIIFGFIIILSSLHIYQVITQLSFNYYANLRVWDFINWGTAIMFLMITHWVVRRDKRHSEYVEHRKNK